VNILQILDETNFQKIFFALMEEVYSRYLEPLKKKISILLQTIFEERRKLGSAN